MYDRILITLEASGADIAILRHIRPLATLCKSKLVLLHVADGWAARKFGEDAVSEEVNEDRAYLEKVRAELSAEGFEVEAALAFGDPATEIIKWIRERGCDLVAMSTHGHRFIGDLIHGTTASRVQHQVSVPVLLLRAK